MMNMKYLNLAMISVLLIMASGCFSDHLIGDRKYREQVDASFAETQKLSYNRHEALFSVFDDELSDAQSEALKFLYAYLPLNDLADYTGEFFLANVNMSLRAREETSWGKSIPADVFLHYVLPVRVNNENLDSFRISCYDEIMARMAGNETIIDAALEINHWCHEKVTYQPSDSRTSAPLSTMLSARGRCGEESTFTVAALRTAGIPARQVYTPRWAHSDDNHAWVEIWSGGSWYYMGACEPEPVIDRGWFTEPARRAMLVHIKAIGAYNGNEKVISRHPKYAEINNLPKYAVTKEIFVKTVDPEGIPVTDALVEYQLYNYAEFYPLASVPSDRNGISSFITGLGDLIVWGRLDDHFDFKKISVAETDTVTLTLREGYEPESMDLDLEVPVLRSPLPGPSSALVEANSIRLREEDSIRLQYIDSWINSEQILEFADRCQTKKPEVATLIGKSMGNYRQIIEFLQKTPEPLRKMAVTLLGVISEKDLRDTKADILTDHLNYSVPYAPDTRDPDDEFFTNYILNPRISNEILSPWRSHFILELPEEIKTKAPDNPSVITEWFNENITVDNYNNYLKTALTPIGVSELRVSDSRSRDICFVAVCRSLGIPSRLEPGSMLPQYWLDSSWHDVYFGDQKRPSDKKGYIRLTSADTDPVPEYYTHFTIARFSGGRYNTLQYDYNRRIDTFSEELPLTPGKYMLVTGNRLSRGKILSGLLFFELMEDEHKTLEIKLRKDIAQPQIIGQLETAGIVSLLSGSANAENGLVALWMDPGTEPAKHVLNDLPLLKKELDARNIQFIFFSGSEIENRQGLPENSLFLGLSDNPYADIIREPQREFSLPLIVVSDSKGNILYMSEGYTIGIGEQILKAATNF